MNATPHQSPDSTTTQQPATQHSPAISPAGARLWTLAATVIVFLWIFWTICAFILQRLSGEPVSPTCSLEIRQLNPASHLPDSQVLLTATDFQSFRGVAGQDGQCQLTLMLNAGGLERVRNMQNLPPNTELAVMVAGKVITSVPLSAATSGQSLELVLTDVSASDANEIFARLTE
ncbi:MAG: hypothetical protein ACKO2P_00820 [Planctomycetota bacterium]